MEDVPIYSSTRKLANTLADIRSIKLQIGQTICERRNDSIVVSLFLALLLKLSDP